MSSYCLRWMVLLVALQGTVACDSSGPRQLSSSQSELTAGLGAYWSFDTISSGVASDLAGAGHDVTLQNGASSNSSGRVGNALQLDGVDDQAVRANAGAALKPANAFSISAWVKTSGTDTSGSEVVSMGDSYGVRIQNNGNVRVFAYIGSTWVHHTTTGLDVRDNKWHHIVGQDDRAHRRYERGFAPASLSPG